jgi:hypothetical protein
MAGYFALIQPDKIISLTFQLIERAQVPQLGPFIESFNASEVIALAT